MFAKLLGLVTECHIGGIFYKCSIYAVCRNCTAWIYIELFELGIEPKHLPLIAKHPISFILRLHRDFDKRLIMVIYILFLLYFLVMQFSYTLSVLGKYLTAKNTLHFCTMSCQCGPCNETSETLKSFLPYIIPSHI